MYILKSEYFNDKIRYFDTPKDLNNFLDARIPKIMKAHRKTYQDIYNKMNITEVDVMNIGSGNAYPSNALSNFAPHTFTIDGIKCASMEGFLQALKTSNPDMQEHICGLVGIKAKKSGASKNWKRKQTLYWKGQELKRNSDEYTQLITRAYDQLYKNTNFQKALLASGNATFTHSMGRRKKNETVLTVSEFTGQLTRLRNKLKSEVSQ